MTEMGKFYGLPVYINVGLTDSKTLDAQAGAEKAATLLAGALAGADMFGHAGICGTDHAGSLAWLAADNELMNYVRRIVRGFEIGPEHLATDIIQAVGPAGSYLAEEHTVAHFRSEIWPPGPSWTRQGYSAWEAAGRSTFGDRLAAEVRQILKTHQVAPLDEGLSREIDRIVAAAQIELAAL